MSLTVQVDAHSGYKANERPLRFTLDDDTYEIAEVEDQWYSPEALYFKVLTQEGQRFVLRYDEQGARRRRPESQTG